MNQDSFPQFKPSLIKFTYREVPFWARAFQKLGLFTKVGKIVKIKLYKANVFVNTGKLSLLKRMAGGLFGATTYLALGDGEVSPPDETDVLLENELFRKAMTQRWADVLTLYTKTFITSSEGNNTYKEMGLFGDSATAVADTGTLFTRLAIDESKAFGQSLTIEYNIIAT